MAGPEFKQLLGHVLVMYKALYGTRSGGAFWHDMLFDSLQQMDFKPSKADPEIWMRSSKDDTHYEYTAVYVDDPAICMQDPQAFCDTLKEIYKLKLKDIGPLSYDHGYGYNRDADGHLLQIQGNMLTTYLSPMKKCLGRNQRSPEHQCCRMSPRN